MLFRSGTGPMVKKPAIWASVGNTLVSASRPMIRSELLADTNVFPTDAQIAGFFTIGPVPQAAERARTRLWARFKAGK